MQYADADVETSFFTVSFDLSGDVPETLFNRKISLSAAAAALLRRMLAEREKNEPYSGDIILSSLQTLLLSVLAVEGLHGASRVRLDAKYCFDAGKHACVIDADTVVGQDISRIFMGFATREFGEEAFAVSRAERVAKAETEDLSA